MTVYVESNFVLAIALGQEDAASATTILELAERGAFDLVFPALAVTEPLSTVVQRGRERRRLSSSLKEQVRELSRSKPHASIAAMLDPIPVALAEIEEREVDLLLSTVRRLLATGRTLPLTLPVFDQALAYQDRYDLSPQDAIILSAVVSDLAQLEGHLDKCFVSKNWKDFGHPGVAAELSLYRCAYAESFESAISLIAG